jgi:hypothetical protein
VRALRCRHSWSAGRPVDDLYDLFDPTGGEGEGRPLPADAPSLFGRVRAGFSYWQNVSVNRGNVPQVLGEIAPQQIAFPSIDMNNAEAELGGLDVRLTRSILAASSCSATAAGVPIAPKRSPPTEQGLVVKG